MLRFLLSFLFIFFMLSTFSFAKKISDAYLQQEYGPKLTEAPYFLRVVFYNHHHKDWKNSYYSERYAFLEWYEEKVAADQAQENAEARIEATKEKELLREKMAAERQERDRLRAESAEEKAEKKADEEREKAFNSELTDQQRQLQQMEQNLTQQRNL